LPAAFTPSHCVIASRSILWCAYH